MASNEEKRYKIKKIEQYNDQISSMKSQQIKDAMVTAVFSVGTVVLLSKYCVSGDLFGLIYGVTSGAISICGLISQADTRKEIRKLESERGELNANQFDEVLKRGGR